MLILAASNNEDAFKSIGKFTGDYARILSYPSFEEMKCQSKIYARQFKRTAIIGCQY